MKAPTLSRTAKLLGGLAIFAMGAFLNVFPVASRDDRFDAHTIHAVNSAQSVGILSQSASLPNLQNFLFGEFGKPMGFSSNLNMTTLGKFVSYVFFGSSQSKMARITTFGVVTRMQDPHTFWNWRFKDMVRNSVGGEFHSTSKANYAVAPGADFMRPFPTLILWPGGHHV